MKRTDRFWAVCLILVLLFTSIQGCGSKKASEPAQESETAGEETEGSKTAEEAPAANQEDVQKPEAEPLSDTVRWFNASYAVLTDLNNWDYTIFGGMEPSDNNQALIQQLLKQWWDVTDRATADETLDWILEEGHRLDFGLTMLFLGENGITDVDESGRAAWILENFDVSEEEAQIYADCYSVYLERGEDAIAGWDYCRALNLMGYYYIAGYYTEEEALDKSLEIAKIVQPLFTSWDDLIDSYMWGYEYWAEESSADRRTVYEDLKTRDDNPYGVDYQTTLEKTW